MQANAHDAPLPATRARSRAVRLVAGGLVGLGGLLAFGQVAFGHPTFAPAEAVPPASDQSLGLHVPPERPDTYNRKVIAQVPAGFEVRGPCPEKPDWRCTVTTPTASRKESLVTWERTAGNGDPDDLFAFSVRTPEQPGSYPFKVNQIYADGENVAWHGEPNSDLPAPVLEVR